MLEFSEHLLLALSSHRAAGSLSDVWDDVEERDPAAWGLPDANNQCG